jgi:hypothetical protein
VLLKNIKLMGLFHKFGKKYELDRLITKKTFENISIKAHPKPRFYKIMVLWIRDIAALLKPFLPETSEKIEKQFAGPSIKSEGPLFPRIK